jgi:hypothetical protein
LRSALAFHIDNGPEGNGNVYVAVVFNITKYAAIVYSVAGQLNVNPVLRKLNLSLGVNHDPIN